MRQIYGIPLGKKHLERHKEEQKMRKKAAQRLSHERSLENVHREIRKSGEFGEFTRIGGKKKTNRRRKNRRRTKRRKC